MEDVKESRFFDFPTEEDGILKYWESIDAFEEQLRRTEGKPEYVFFDGPPFATGMPHYGHLLAGTIKDIVTRYASATGHHVSRRFGWDCHGLPVEYEIDKKLGVKTRQDVLDLGIGKYNEECRNIVMRYSKEWESIVTRMGRWIDFENDYKTLDPTFMESVWWVFKQLYEKDLVYKGFKVMPYSTGCGTALSNFEAGQNYKDVSDPAVTVSFPIDDDPDGACMVAWTTTPWTLPSNLALCVNPEFTYLRVRDPATGNVYVVAKERLGEIPGAVPKKRKGKKGAAEGEGGQPAGFEILKEISGADLVGKTYKPLFPYFEDLKKDGAFKVCGDSYVTSDSGTGIVHQAPAFGEDDYRVCLAHGVIKKGGVVPCPVNEDGCFTEQVSDFQGKHVKEADKGIIAFVKDLGRLVQSAAIVHSYPFCWRSDTPLIYRTVPSWFVKVEDIKPQLLENNAKTMWVPSYVKEKRFHNWLEGARDWAISRSRFWGTPIPIWVSDDGEEIVVIGSKQELEDLTGEKVTDLHRHFIDHLTIPSRQGKGQLKRVEDVFDCWFESGSMPYAQAHYPFENVDKFEENFPGDFVAEGLDQTRGWFYTMMVLSTALFDRPAFRNLVCNGLVLASDGKKMSKRLKNYPDPMDVVHKYGADALRLYLINSPVVRAETLRFKEDGVHNVVREIFLPWYNAYRFAAQNVLRWEAETGSKFDPEGILTSEQSNVLDMWISASSRSLTRFIHDEMTSYRLYTVIPYLVKFIDNLTNIYVRYNRKRLKGKNGPEDTGMALATLHHVLITLCKAMAPFTPFFTESMYQNLKKALPADQPASVHWCDFPEAEPERPGDKQLEESVDRMQSVIELVRQLRDKHNRPLKTAIKELTVVHADEKFLEDITGRLKEFVIEECNAISVKGSSDQLKYGILKASPIYGELGQRMGKKMASILKAIKHLPVDQILIVKEGGSIEIEGEKITGADISISQEFKLPEGYSPDELDAAVDGGILVAADLRVDEAMLAAKTAREFVNRVQKLRKASGVRLQDTIEVFVKVQSGHGDDFLSVLEAQESYILDTVGVPIEPVEKLRGAAEGPHIFVETYSLDVMGKGMVEFEVLIFNVSMVNTESLAKASLTE